MGTLAEIGTDERERIANAIVTAFDKFGNRYNERIRAEWGSLTEKEKNELRALVRQVDMLLSKRAFIPGFYRYVLKNVMSNRRLKRHRRVLVKAFVISMLSPTGVRTGDVFERTDKKRDAMERNEPPAYTRRNEQRILNDYYKDTLFKLDKTQGDNANGDNLAPLFSVFSAVEPPNTLYSSIVKEQYSAVTNYNLSNERVVNGIVFSVILQTIMPERWEDIRFFREECREVITQELRLIAKKTQRARRPFQKEELQRREKLAKFFLAQVTDYLPIFTEFYFHFASILAFEYLRSRRPEKRTKLLSRGFPLRFTDSDIVRTRKLALTQGFFEEGIDKLLIDGLQGYALIEKSFSRFRLCFENSGLPELDIALVFENVAIIHRERRNYKFMRLFMKYAIEHYQKAGNPYRICLALKNMGEAEWYMGFKKKAMSYFDKSEKSGNVLPDAKERYGVLRNLVVASRRIGEVKLERNYLKQCLEVLPDTETETILQIESRLEELDDFY